jgi:metal iron transporter
VAIIATDLAELLGSAIALCLLFPKLELWQGVLITAFDVILILGMGDPLRGRPVKIFEVLIAAMVCCSFVCEKPLMNGFIGSCGPYLYDSHRRKGAS